MSNIRDERDQLLGILQDILDGQDAFELYRQTGYTEEVCQEWINYVESLK